MAVELCILSVDLMIFSHRLLIQAIVTAIIEGSSGIALYSLGYPNNPYALSSSGGVLLFLIFFNLYTLILLSGAMTGHQPGAPSTPYIFDQIIQTVGGIIGMFIVVTIIGEGIVWLSRETGQHK